MSLSTLLGWLAAALFYAAFIYVLCRALGANRLTDTDAEEPHK